MKIFIHNYNHNPRDPSVIHHNGLYYHCFSQKNQICLCVANKLEELASVAIMGFAVLYHMKKGCLRKELIENTSLNHEEIAILKD